MSHSIHGICAKTTVTDYQGVFPVGVRFIRATSVSECKPPLAYARGSDVRLRGSFKFEYALELGNGCHSVPKHLLIRLKQAGGAANLGGVNPLVKPRLDDGQRLGIKGR
jgi:hypothetical protein